MQKYSRIVRGKAEEEDGPEKGHLLVLDPSILHRRAVAAGGYPILDQEW